MAAKQHTQADIAIVGAGLAGLRTAVDLAAAGKTVTLFEARDRVGGRVLSALSHGLPSSDPPSVLDLGGQWVGPGQTEILKLIDELGLHLVPTEISGRTVWGLENGEIQQADGEIPPLAPHVLDELMAAGRLIARTSEDIDLDEPWRGPDAHQWDQISAEDWIQSNLHTDAGREFARTYLRGNTATEPAEASLLGMLFALRSVGPAGDLLTAEAQRIREGSQQIAVELAHRLGDRIRYSDPVRTIKQDEDGVTVESDTCVLRCRRVVVCVPPPLAANIAYTPALPADRANLLASLKMGASVKFHAVYSRPFWREQGLSGQAVSMTGPVGTTYDNSPDDGTGRGVLVGLSVADEARQLGGLDHADQRRRILEALVKFFGPAAAEPEDLVIRNWNTEQWTRGCYAAHFPVGVWTRSGSAFRAPCERIHWAGTETSSEWHGYMEGALRSGSRAALEVQQADELPLEELTRQVRAALDELNKVLGEHHIGGARHPAFAGFHRGDEVYGRGQEWVDRLVDRLMTLASRNGPLPVLLVLWYQTYEVFQVTLAYTAIKVVKQAAEKFVRQVVPEANLKQAVPDPVDAALMAVQKSFALITTDGLLFQLVNMSDAVALKDAAEHAAARAKATKEDFDTLLEREDVAELLTAAYIADIRDTAAQLAVFYPAGVAAAVAVQIFEKWLDAAPVMDKLNQMPADSMQNREAVKTALTAVQDAIAAVENARESLHGLIYDICEPWERMLVAIRDLLNSATDKPVFAPKKASFRYCYPFAVDLNTEALPWNGDKSARYDLERRLEKALNQLNVGMGPTSPLGSSQFFYREKGHYGGLHVPLGSVKVKNMTLRSIDEFDQVVEGEPTCAVWLELSDMGNHCLCIEPRPLSKPRPDDLDRAVRMGSPFVIGQTAVVDGPPAPVAKPSGAADDLKTLVEPFTPTGETEWQTLHAFSRDVVVAVAEALLGSRRRSDDWFKSRFEPGSLHVVAVAHTYPPPGTRLRPRDIERALDTSIGGKILLRSKHQTASALADWVCLQPMGECDGAIGQCQCGPTVIEQNPLGMAGDWFTNTGEMTVFGFVAAPQWHFTVYSEAAQFASSWSPLLRLWSRRLQQEISAAEVGGTENEELRKLERKVRLHLMQIRAEDLCTTRAHREFLDQLLDKATLGQIQSELEAQLVATEHLTDWFDANKRQTVEDKRDKDEEIRQKAEKRRNVLLTFIALLSIFGLTGFLAELDREAGQNFLWSIPVDAHGMWENNALIILFIIGLILAAYFDLFGTSWGWHDKASARRKQLKQWLGAPRVDQTAWLHDKWKKLLGRVMKMKKHDHRQAELLPIRDMHDRNVVSKGMVERIYAKLLEASFGSDELDPLDTLLEGLEPDEDGTYATWGLCINDGDRPVGCILGYPDPDSGVLLIGYLVVNPRLRSQGTGSRLIAEVRERWFGDLNYTVVLAEVEDPRHHDASQGSDPEARARLYERQGMQIIVGPYFQPKLAPGKERVRNLFLCVLNESTDPTSWRDSVPGDQIAEFLLNYFHESGEGEDWPRDDDEEGKQLLAFYRERARVPLRPMSDRAKIEIPELPRDSSVTESKSL